MASTNDIPTIHALSAVSFSERWELLKPVIERLYLKENVKLPKLKEILRDTYAFDASESQYKYQISKKWQMRKNIPTPKMAAMIDMRQTRPTLGSHSAFKYRGTVVENKKLRRYIKESTRAQRKAQAQMEITKTSTPISLEASKIIMSWNMPYGAMKAAGAKKLDHFSPAAAVSTPSDVAVATPHSNNATSLQSAVSPFSQALEKKNSMNRAQLFLDGRRDELMKSMNKSERYIASNWLYQFWLFSFKTAKAWGRGPRRWNADDLAFERYDDLVPVSATDTPGVVYDTDVNGNISTNADSQMAKVRPEQKPTDLCRWAVHTKQTCYGFDADDFDERSFEDDQINDPDDENSWSEWPLSWHQPDLPNVLRNGLENNDFSTFKKDTLPMNVSEVLKVTPRAPDEMLREAFVFSIIGRNGELVEKLASRMRRAEASFVDLYPLHLAATYLDGSKTCCNILDTLIQCLKYEETVRSSVYDEQGYTVLDNLMVVIIRSHTTCLPGFIDRRWTKEKRFPGAEVDVCGRWDADSDCIRRLMAEGNPAIPNDWKHKFCHTSAQAIVHSIISLGEGLPRLLLETPSGLFLKRCLSCGLKLELLPLHTTVLTAFMLAQYGLEGEDLFGMLACLLCLLSLGADPRAKMPISLIALLGEEEVDQCSHEMFDAADLASNLQSRFAGDWPEDIEMGWQILVMVLVRSRQQWIPQLPQDHQVRRIRVPDLNATDVDLAFEPEYAARGHSHDLFDTMEVVHGHPEEDDTLSETCSTQIDLADDLTCQYSDLYDEHHNYFGKDRLLGKLWAAVRTEMLTYRRLAVGDDWNSTNFDNGSVYESLLANEDLNIGLVANGLMQDHCRCGHFEAEFLNAVTMQDVSAHYFANLEDYNRITVIHMPARYVDATC